MPTYNIYLTRDVKAPSVCVFLPKAVIKRIVYAKHIAGISFFFHIVARGRSLASRRENNY